MTPMLFWTLLEFYCSSTIAKRVHRSLKPVIVQGPRGEKRAESFKGRHQLSEKWHCVVNAVNKEENGCVIEGNGDKTIDINLDKTRELC